MPGTPIAAGCAALFGFGPGFLRGSFGSRGFRGARCFLSACCATGGACCGCGGAEPCGNDDGGTTPDSVLINDGGTFPPPAIGTGTLNDAIDAADAESADGGMAPLKSVGIGGAGGIGGEGEPLFFGFGPGFLRGAFGSLGSRFLRSFGGALGSFGGRGARFFLSGAAGAC